MIDANELRKGITFKLNGNLYKVTDYHHHKPGRGNAIIRVKAKNLRTGTNLEKTFSSGERVQDISLDYHNVQYLYNDGDYFYFMDLDTFEQPSIPRDIIGKAAKFLKEGIEVKLTLYDNEPIEIGLPISVDLKVIKSEASVRGDTATGINKKVTVETGIQVDVPNFITEGDIIRIDTRNGAYITRVNE